MQTETIKPKQLELFPQEKTDQVIENVRRKLLERSQVGIRKYGTTLHENNRDNFLNHLQMELMDACNYVEKELMKNIDIKELINYYPNDQMLGYAIRKIYESN